MLYANVIIDISHEKVDKSFQYIVPNKLVGKISIGDCIKVPFGKGDTVRTGYVIALTSQNEFPVDRMKEIIDISENETGLEGDAIKLACWIKENYGSTMIAALKTVLPAKKVVQMKERKKIVRKLSSEEVMSLYGECSRKNQVAKARVLKELIKEDVLPYDLVSSKLNVSVSTLSSLQKAGIISIEKELYYRNPVRVFKEGEDNIVLSKEQEDIVNRISANPGTHLIHGITGSGKTEVYIELIDRTVKKGKQCIMLIPEIALTYQTLMRFYKRFGDRVSVINSTLSPGEKYDQCQRALKGDIDVIIGPRSALFVPFPNLGMVIIDEEHENSYVSEQTPRYHAVDTAGKLCQIKGATLVLGSATPSIDSYYMATKGVYTLHKLCRRLTGGSLPQTQIVDLREELRAGNKSVFSRRLQDAISDRLEKGEQIMLFLNRRGYSGFISCRACGHVIKCPHCDVSLSKHKGGKMICHYCGYEQAEAKTCPACGSKYISAFKAGTQQIEETVNKMYPAARVLRMDADTTKTKDSYDNILSRFKEGEADILIGTQMIVKGHDFPNVTLVGIIAADLSLNESDFRSGERTFQLLTQACGRAGRGTKEGLSIIQTYRPEHYSIVLASKQDYEAFYEEELAYRAVCDYPPAGVMMEILVTSYEQRRALGLATALKKKVPEGIHVIGPSVAPISKLNDSFRYNLFLKSKDVRLINEVRDIMEEYLRTAPLESETVTFDIK